MTLAMNSEMNEPPKLAGPIMMLKNDLMNMKLVLRCGICCSTLRDPVVTTCCHPFCKECLHQCIDKLKMLRCPICNQHLNKRNCGVCPQLNCILDEYLKFVKAFKRDCAKIRLLKESEFDESQLIATQNVATSIIGRSPLRPTTNIIISNSKEQPSPSKDSGCVLMKRSFDRASDSDGTHTECQPPEQKQPKICESKVDNQPNGIISKTAPIKFPRKLSSAFRLPISKLSNLPIIYENFTDSSATPSEVQSHANANQQQPHKQAQQISDESLRISESPNEQFKRFQLSDCADVLLSPQKSYLSKAYQRSTTITTQVVTDQRASNVVVSDRSQDQNLPDGNANADNTKGIPIRPPSSSLEYPSGAADKEVDMVVGSDATTVMDSKSDVAIKTVENQYGKVGGVETSDQNEQQEMNSLQICDGIHNTTDVHISQQNQLQERHLSEQSKIVSTEGIRSNNITKSDAFHENDKNIDRSDSGEGSKNNKRKRDVCVQISLPVARREVKIQVKHKCKDSFTQTDFGSSMAGAINTIDLEHDYVVRNAIRCHVSSQTPSVSNVDASIQVEQLAIDIRINEVSTQTDAESDDCAQRTMDIQTDFYGIDRIRIVDKDSVDSETGSMKRLSVDCCVQTTTPNLDRFKSDASEAVNKLELMVTRRFEKQPAETRVQALLACLPWIPTFIGMSYDDFCERFDRDDITKFDQQRLTNNAERIDTNDDECHSVVEESEVATEKYVCTGDGDLSECNRVHSNIQQNENNLDDNKKNRCHPERQQQSKMQNCSQESVTKCEHHSQPHSSSESNSNNYNRSSSTIPNNNNSLMWSSQQNVSIASKINTFITNRKQVVTDSLETCPTPSSFVAIKFMVSGLKQTSEAEQVKSFLKMFPTSCLSHEMTRDCTHLIIYNTENRLCKSRSLKYAYAIANRCIIVTHQWVVDSIEQKQLQSIDGYEVEGDQQVNRCSRAARRSRQGNGDLFSGFTFYLPIPYFRFSKIVTKELLQELIEMTSGKCVDRLWDLPSSKRAFIIFAPGSSSVSAARKFELDKGVEVLRADWILDSVCEYRLLLDNTQIYRVGNPIDHNAMRTMIWTIASVVIILPPISTILY